MNISQYDILQHNGQSVLVLAVDPDPRASVWVSMVADPDSSRFVSRAELTK